MAREGRSKTSPDCSIHGSKWRADSLDPRYRRGLSNPRDSMPDSTTELILKIRYITDQASTNSVGHDSFGSALLGFISPGTVLMYPDGWSIDQVRVDAQGDAATGLGCLDSPEDGRKRFRRSKSSNTNRSRCGISWTAPSCVDANRKVYELVDVQRRHLRHIDCMSSAKPKSVLTLPDQLCSNACGGW